MTQLFANAPVTWGVWGPHSLPEGRTPRDILRALRDAGYTGVELGALGFFGLSPTETADTLAEYGLRSAGAYVPLRPLHGVDVMAGDLENLRAVCATLAACPGTGPVILAEETEAVLKRHVQRGDTAPELDLDNAQWANLIAGMVEAGRIAADFGLPVSYHPHTGTHIEQPHEVDRFLSGCDLDMTLDTGHAAAGGDDPLDLLRRWGDRVNHVHVKDLKLAPVERAQKEGLTFGMAEASAALGEGDLDMAAFMAALADRDYRGWVVVEQDRRPDGGHDHADVDAEQKRNLEWVKAHAGWLSKTI
ncbi:TIM barrel protein [Devosia naphthalenivorans]|uniref:TIM barrel protein n=1 Tax=Devosia naphthalenivorans TaxID=2082392 RepID=UPI000D3AEE82|nr:TIM barrel protein [Devosia naphthalenivorans]